MVLLEDGRQILTLRGYPKLPWEDTITPKRTFSVTSVWEELLALDVFSIESQLTHLYYPAFLQQDTSAFNQLLKEHQQQFQLYGFDSHVQVMMDYCATLSRVSKEIIDFLETNDIIDQGTTAGECSSILKNYRQ